MIDWKENGTPVSRQFEDIYFSLENGWEETKHVFLKGNRLEERWTSDSTRKSHFSILELGFGTGLNFFAAWDLWRKTKDRSSFSRLRFVSYELYPLDKFEIQKAISAFPELSEILSVFLEKYKLLVPGCNSFVFEKEKLILDLWIGDARLLLPETSGKFDAFFLDGFAPSKNPELWGEKIGSEIARLSSKDATFATFTVAKLVKESLTKAGFHLIKLPGFGRKREMLSGIFLSEPIQEKENPVFYTRKFSDSNPRKILVVGGGLAGASISRSLAWRGYSVQVWDNDLEPRASSIPKAISHPHLTKIPSPTSLWTIRALGHSLRRYSDFLPKEAYGITGTSQISGEDLPWERLKSGLEAHSLSSEIGILQNGLPLQFLDNANGIFYPSGFWTETPILVRSLLQYPNIEYKKGTVESIKHNSEEWSLFSSSGEELAKGEALVLANSFGIEKLLSDFWGESLFPITRVRGQLEILEDLNISETSEPIRVGEHYLTPNINGIRILGSTFDEFDLDLQQREKDREELFEYAKRTFSGIDWEKIHLKQEFVGIRSQTKDRFPVLGPVQNPVEFRKHYSGIGLPKNQKKDFPFLEPTPNLYVFGGLGSRGVLSCLLGGEILASIILGEPLPVEKSLYSAFHPGRFLYRKIRTMEQKGDP